VAELAGGEEALELAAKKALSDSDDDWALELSQHWLNITTVNKRQAKVFFVPCMEL